MPFVVPQVDQCDNKFMLYQGTASCYCGNSNGMLPSLTDAIKQEAVYVYEICGR